MYLNIKNNSNEELEIIRDIEKNIERKLNDYPYEIRRVLLLCFCSIVIVFQELDLEESCDIIASAEESNGGLDEDEIENRLKYTPIPSIPFDAIRILWQELLELQPEEFQDKDNTNDDPNNSSETQMVLSKLINNFAFQVHPWKKFLSEREYTKFREVALVYQSPLNDIKPKVKDKEAEKEEDKEKNPFEKFCQDIMKNFQDNSENQDPNNAIDYVRDQLLELGLIKVFHCSPCGKNKDMSEKLSGLNDHENSGDNPAILSRSSSITSATSFQSEFESKSNSKEKSDSLVEEVISKRSFDFLQIKSDSHYQYGMKLCHTPVQENGFQFLCFNSTFHFLTEVMAAACLRQRQRLETEMKLVYLNEEHSKERNLIETMIDDASVFTFRLLPSLMMRAQRICDVTLLLETRFFLSERITILKIDEAIHRTMHDHRELQLRKYKITRYERVMIKSFFTMKDCFFTYKSNANIGDNVERQVIEGLHEFVVAMNDKGWVEEAIELCEDILEYENVRLNPKSMLTLRTLQHLGNFYSLTNKLSEAINVLTRALEIDRFYHGVETQEYAAACRNLAVLHSAVKDYDKTIEFYEEALMTQINLKGFKAVSELYGQLGVVHNIRKDFNKALCCYKKALKATSIPQDGFDSQAAFLYYNIGNIHFQQNDYSAAIENYMKSLNLEDNSEAAARTLFSMGTACINNKIPNNALVCFEQSLDIRKERGNAKEIAQTLLSMANVCCDQGLYGVSLDYYKEAEPIMYNIVGAKREYIDLMRNIAYVLNKKGDNEKSISMYKQALEMCRRVYGEKNLDVADILYETAQISSQISEETEAIRLYEESLAVRILVKGDKDKDVVAAKNNLGVLHLKLGKFEIALSYFEDVLRIEKETGGESGLRIPDVLHKIGLAYKGLHKDDLASEYKDAYQVHGSKLKQKVNQFLMVRRLEK